MNEEKNWNDNRAYRVHGRTITRASPYRKRAGENAILKQGLIRVRRLLIAFSFAAYHVYQVLGWLRHLSLVVRKPWFGGFDLVPHKPGCTAIEDS